MPLSSVVGAQSIVKPGVCTSSTRPASPYDGQVIYMTDVDQTAVWDGTQWTVLAPIAGGRNAVINGGMDVWQRGTTSTSTADGYLVADRWYAYKSAGNTTLSRQTASLDNFTYSLRFQRVSGATEVGVKALAYMLENTTTARLVNKTITLSFWAKSGANYSAASSSLSWTLVTGTGSTDVNFLSTGYTGQANAGSGSITLTTSWQRFSVSISVPSGKTQMGFYFSYTPVGTAGANDWFEVTGVQLEAGAVATPFEFEDISQTLEKCLRYYQKSWADAVVPLTSGDANGLVYASSYTAASVSHSIGQITFQVPFRATPTVTIYGYSPATAGVVSNVQGTNLAANSGLTQFITTKSANVYNGSGGSITPNLGGYLFHYVASAEL